MSYFGYLRTYEAISPNPVDALCLHTHQLSDGYGFPPSYQAFATQLGWGRLLGLFLVYLPLGQHPDSWLIRSPFIRQAMDAFYEETEYDSFLLEPDGYESLARDLLPFAMSENGEYLAWDTANRAPNQELPIYVLAARMGGIRFAGPDLYSFIEKCADDVAVKTVLGPGYNKLPLVFEALPLAE